MLEMIDLNKKLKKQEHKERIGELERSLAELQRQLKDAGIPALVIFEGLEAAGKGTCINRLMLPLDPRGFKVHPIHPPNEEEALRPFLVRFFNRLPARGRLAIFDQSWYGRVLGDRVERRVKEDEVQQAYEDIRAFERQQADEGAVLVKFWMHISKKEQAKRFNTLLKNPVLAWKVGKPEKRQHKRFERYLEAAEEMLERTNTPHSPWVVIESHDQRFAQIKVFETLEAIFKASLARHEALKSTPPPPPSAPLAGRVTTVLSGLDLTQQADPEAYDALLETRQERLRELEHQIYTRRIPVVICFEGCDAAGKGGAIKRLTENLDPRGYEVIPIAAPTREELDHHYLWRFARALPKAGHITVFDRTWYGRVLVERVEGFCSPAAWQRAYHEINEWESHLANFGTVLVKFWLHIDQDEQLKRFEERQHTPWKQWKITEEDWRNRDKWPLYEVAVNDMLVNCSTSFAPFTIVEANDKKFARLKVLETVITRIEAKL